eukprot:scaffold7686_cov111-Isochrysis_galbana.AAC.1
MDACSSSSPINITSSAADQRVSSQPKPASSQPALAAAPPASPPSPCAAPAARAPPDRLRSSTISPPISPSPFPLAERYGESGPTSPTSLPTPGRGGKLLWLTPSRALPLGSSRQQAEEAGLRRGTG